MNKNRNTLMSTIRHSCAAAGYKLENITCVRDGTFRATLANGQIGSTAEVYIRLYPEEDREILKTFVSLDDEIRFPSCQVIDRDVLCLLMASAPGRPLSQLLPILTVPGVWRLAQDRLTEAYFQIGHSIGSLHSSTETEPGPILTLNNFKKAIDRTELLRNEFTDSKIETAKQILKWGRKAETPHAVVYTDRSPHNIFFNLKNITHIDPGVINWSPIVDHSTVILGFRLMIDRLPYANESVKSALEHAYWQGYEQTGIGLPVERKHIQIRLLSKYLGLLNLYQSEPMSMGMKLVSRIDPPILYQKVDGLLEDFETDYIKT